MSDCIVRMCPRVTALTSSRQRALGAGPATSARVRSLLPGRDVAGAMARA